VEGSYELPAFRTLNDMATTIRARANEEIFAAVLARLGNAGIARLERLLVVGAGGKSEFNQLKRPARRPSWSNFRRQLEHQRWVDELGEARAWWQGVPPSKITGFAGEAASADAAVMGCCTPAKRVALLAALVFTAQARARDDTAEMFCRRVSTLTRRSRDELEALKQQHQEITERLVTNHGDNHVPLVARHFRNDRAAMLAMAGAPGLEATSADRSVLDLLEHVREHAGLTRDYIPDHIVPGDQAGTPLPGDPPRPRSAARAGTCGPC